MKYNRNSFSYRFHHWVNVKGWEEWHLGEHAGECLAVVLMFLAIFFLPYFFF